MSSNADSYLIFSKNSLWNNNNKKLGNLQLHLYPVLQNLKLLAETLTQTANF